MLQKQKSSEQKDAEQPVPEPSVGLVLEGQYAHAPVNALAEIFSYRGRYTRSRFWGVYVVTILLAGSAALFPLWVALPYLAVLTWISIGAIVKRFHDRSKSGWWALVGFVPFVGSLWILVDCGLMEGAPGENEFGARALTLF